MALGRRGRDSEARHGASVDAALRRSLRAAVAGDRAAAETWLERVVEADTADLHAYHALAELYREQGAIGRAIRMHQNLLLRRDLDRRGRTEALLELARDFDAGGFGERAIASYEEVLDTEPRNAEVLERLARLLHAQRDFARALVLVKKLRRQDRETADALERELLLAQAQSEYDEGESDAARSTLRRLLKRDRGNVTAWTLLGELEVERGRDAKALDAWKKGVLADPAGAGALYAKLDASYSASGKRDAYEKLLRGLLERSPEAAATRIALGRLLASRGESAAAIEELARAIEVAPRDARLRVELGRLLLEAGHEAEALKAYGSLLEALERGEIEALEATQRVARSGEGTDA